MPFWQFFRHGVDGRALLKFIYSEEATKFCEISTLNLSFLQKDLGQKMTPVKIRDLLIKSWVLSPENGPQ